jgi:hypothetical protein
MKLAPYDQMTDILDVTPRIPVDKYKYFGCTRACNFKAVVTSTLMTEAAGLPKYLYLSTKIHDVTSPDDSNLNTKYCKNLRFLTMLRFQI